MKKNEIHYFYLLDIARFIAALLVILWHFQAFGSNQLNRQTIFFPILNLGFKRGFLAVQFFWLLSGFVIANVYAKNWEGTKIFLRHRFARLYPLHFLTLIIVTLLNFICMAEFQKTFIYQNFNVLNFVLHLFFLPGFFMTHGQSFNGPFWSISLELCSYLIFASVMVIRVRTRISLTLTFTVTVIAFGVLDIFVDFPDQIVRANVFFFSGVLLFFLFESSRHQKYMSFLVVLLPPALLFALQIGRAHV